MDELIIGGRPFTSRLLLGTGKFSLSKMADVIQRGETQIVTLALRRANQGGEENILDYVPEGITLLPNTSGARNAKEAVRIARLARELGCGDFVKIEVIRDTKYLMPDNQETLLATEILAKEGFVVLPYIHPDLNVARDLKDAGAAAVMPLGAPIGSNMGLRSKDLFRCLLMRWMCPSLWTQGSASHPRPARLWRWALLRSSSIRRLRRRRTQRPWRLPSSWRWSRDVKRIWQGLAGF